ncbi:WGR domain-containing protein [Nannocystaceae bacterium ST9]
MRRFEFKDARSYKFWEIEITDTHYTVRYGKVGSDGVTQTKAYPSADKVKAEADKKIREKTSKGYAEVASAAPVRAAVADESEDWAVRADRLQVAGDPWGRRIALEMARADASGPDKRKLGKELAELEKAHGEHFFGPELLALMDVEGFDKVARLEWKYGYVVRARVAMPEYGFKGPKVPAVLAALVKSPAGEFLRDLSVGLVDHEGGGLVGVAAALSSGRPLANLETLFLGDFSRDDQEISWVTHGNLEPLWSITPKLRTLRLRGSGMKLGKFEHPSLARLEIETGGLPGDSVASIAAAKLPELRHMEVWFGRTDYGGIRTIETLLPLFSTTGLPKLEHLGLQNSEMQDDIAIALAGSPLLAQVGSVDMSMGTMREIGANALIADAKSFKHLKSLDLDENYIPVELHDRLRKAIPTVKLGRQRTADDEDDYYTSVGE